MGSRRRPLSQAPDAATTLDVFEFEDLAHYLKDYFDVEGWIRDKFEEFGHRDESSGLAVSALPAALKSWGCVPTAKQIENAVRKATSRPSSELTLFEFEEVARYFSGYRGLDPAVRSTFERFDRNGSGDIDVAELQVCNHQVYRHAHHHVTAKCTVLRPRCASCSLPRWAWSSRRRPWPRCRTRAKPTSGCSRRALRRPLTSSASCR